MLKNKNKGKLLWLNLVSFCIGFQSALITYVISSFLKESSGINNIGIFYFIAFGGAFFVMLNLHHLVKRYGKSKVFITFLVFKLLVLIGAGAFAETRMAAIFIVWALMSGQLMWLGQDIMIESFSQDSITGTIRGRILAIENLGWLLAPFISTWIVSRLGYGWVFSLGTIFIIIALLIVLWKFDRVNHNIRKDLSIKEILQKMWRRKNVARIYYASLMLEIFYAAMVVYSPLYLLAQGFSWQEKKKFFYYHVAAFRPHSISPRSDC